MNKKAQSQIITTVLIILLVLAAIVIVWQVVNSTVQKGAEEIVTQSACMGINLEITNIDTTANTVTVRRSTGSSDIGEVTPTTYVNGTDPVTGSGLGPLGTATMSHAPGGAIPHFGIAPGDKIEVAFQLPDGTACGVSSSKTA